MRLFMIYLRILCAKDYLSWVLSQHAKWHYLQAYVHKNVREKLDRFFFRDVKIVFNQKSEKEEGKQSFHDDDDDDE